MSRFLLLSLSLLFIATTSATTATLVGHDIVHDIVQKGLSVDNVQKGPTAENVFDYAKQTAEYIWVMDPRLRELYVAAGVNTVAIASLANSALQYALDGIDLEIIVGSCKNIMRSNDIEVKHIINKCNRKFRQTQDDNERDKILDSCKADLETTYEAHTKKLEKEQKIAQKICDDARGRKSAKTVAAVALGVSAGAIGVLGIFGVVASPIYFPISLGSASGVFVMAAIVDHYDAERAADVVANIRRDINTLGANHNEGKDTLNTESHTA